MIFNERYQYNLKTDLIGRGGFARVFKAIDVMMGRTVALKVFTAETSEKYNLINEIRRVSSYDHANLCHYYDVAIISSVNGIGEDENIQIGVMEYIDGGNIKDYLQLHPEQLNNLLKGVLEGLDYLHEQEPPLVHRDIKPQNILIKNTKRGAVAKITDFGISKLLDGTDQSSSGVLGSIEYMAPEQFEPAAYGINGKISTNTDFWSFGVLLHELLTGHPIFGSRKGGATTEQILRKVLQDDSTVERAMANLPQPYRAMVERCLVKNAANRVQTSNELLMLLSGSNAASPVTAPVQPAPAPTPVAQAPRVEEKEDLNKTVIAGREDDFVPGGTVKKVISERQPVGGPMVDDPVDRVVVEPPVDIKKSRDVWQITTAVLAGMYLLFILVNLLFRSDYGYAYYEIFTTLPFLYIIILIVGINVKPGLTKPAWIFLVAACTCSFVYDIHFTLDLYNSYTNAYSNSYYYPDYFTLKYKIAWESEPVFMILTNAFLIFTGICVVKTRYQLFGILLQVLVLLIVLLGVSDLVMYLEPVIKIALVATVAAIFIPGQLIRFNRRIFVERKDDIASAEAYIAPVKRKPMLLALLGVVVITIIYISIQGGLKFSPGSGTPSAADSTTMDSSMMAAPADTARMMDTTEMVHQADSTKK